MTRLLGKGVTAITRARVIYIDKYLDPLWQIVGAIAAQLLLNAVQVLAK